MEILNPQSGLMSQACKVAAACKDRDTSTASPMCEIVQACIASDAQKSYVCNVVKSCLATISASSERVAFLSFDRLLLY